LKVEGLLNHPTPKKLGLFLADGVEANNRITAVVAEDVALDGRSFANVADGHFSSQQISGFGSAVFDPK
jgi:hypothetical protein